MATTYVVAFLFNLIFYKMKNQYKFIYTIIILICLPNLIKAQLRGSIGIETGYALEDNFSLMYGGSAGVEYGIGSSMSLTANVGFIMNTIDNSVLEGASSYFIPVKLGYRYYFDSFENGLYIHPQIGVHTYSLSYEYKTISGYDSNFNLVYETEKVSVKETYLSYGIGFGSIISEKIDLGLRFNIVSSDGDSFEYFGLRTAYNF